MLPCETVSTSTPRRWGVAVALYLLGIFMGAIDTGIITHKLPLEKMEEGVRAIQSGEAIKVVLKPWMDAK